MKQGRNNENLYKKDGQNHDMAMAMAIKIFSISSSMQSVVMKAGIIISMVIGKHPKLVFMD